MKYDVQIGCRKAGAIGTMYILKRHYVVETENSDEVNRLAIEAAYTAEDIEHVRVEKVRPL